ncbi:MAG: protein kinase [Steroidobacteraceae bacterium]
MTAQIDLQRALEVFDQVVDLAGAERDTRLAALCAGDAVLHERVQAMLDADARPGEPFARIHDGLLPDAAAEQDTMLGRTIGPWKIIAVAGSGGMGTVYEVQRADGAYAQRAALKLVHIAGGAPALRERFLRERQMLAQLRHPHIAALIDGGFTEQGDPWFVMEYVEGMPIDQWCDTRRLDVRARGGLFLQVLEAVSHAHRNLLVHRDLKPSNLLVDAAGDVKLLDFGIARQIGNPDVTVFADRMVTFGYASPEQLHDAPITTATDVWQLGIVLHLLLAGSHPFGITGGTALAKQLQQLAGEPETLPRAAAHATPAQVAARGKPGATDLADTLRGSLAAIVATCLRREPASRYASVDELAADLRRWLQDRPVTAAQSGAGERAQLWLRRNRLLAAAICAVTVALLAGTALSLWQAREARRESARARESLQFLADTLAAASPEQALDSAVSVRQLLDSARQQLEQRHAADPEVHQPVQRMLGRLYFSIGEFGQAARLLGAGTQDVSPRDRTTAIALADDLVVHADALANIEEMESSVAALDRAAALRRQFAPDDPEQQVRALSFQTVGSVGKFGWDACRQQAERALAMALALPHPPIDVVLRQYNDLGSIANFNDDRVRLRQVTTEGLAFADAHAVPAQSPLRFTLLRNHAESLLLDGDYKAAESAARQAIEHAEKTGGIGNTRLPVLYHLLAGAQREQGRYRDALAVEQRVADMDSPENIGPRNTGVMLSTLARLHSLMGDYALSLRLNQRALADVAAANAGDMSRISVENTELQLLLADGQWQPALAGTDRKLAAIRDSQGEDSEQYAQLLVMRVEALRQAGDAARGRQALAEARQRLARRGVPEPHRQFGELMRQEAAFARMEGDLTAAEQAQRQAISNLQRGQNPLATAVARAGLADILMARGDSAEARALLEESLLPRQADRKAAESLGHRLGMRLR